MLCLPSSPNAGDLESSKALLLQCQQHRKVCSSWSEPFAEELLPLDTIWFFCDSAVTQGIQGKKDPVPTMLLHTKLLR